MTPTTTPATATDDTDTTAAQAATDAPAAISESQMRIFALSYLQDAGSAMMKTIREIQDNSSRITKIALGVSVPHQAGFILSLVISYLVPRWTMSSWTETPILIIEAITGVSMAILIPVATDLAILNTIKTVGAVLAPKKAKALALIEMTVLVGVSGVVNFLAPGPALTKYLAVFAVTLIPMMQSLRALVRPNFAAGSKLEKQIENEVPIEVAGPVEAEVTTTPVVDGKEQHRLRQRAVAEARKLANVSPMMTAAQLRKATGVSHKTASKVLTDVRAGIMTEAVAV